MLDAVRNRFGIPAETPLVVTDSEGYDVILDNTLPTGSYTIAPAFAEEKIAREMNALFMTEKQKCSITKVPIPTPKENQVLIKVVAAGINPVDWKILWWNWTEQPLPHVLGSDVSGIVVKVGSKVKDFKVGDQVFTTINLWEAGSFAEYAVSNAARLSHKGSKVSHIQAASLPIAFLSAWDGVTKVKFEAKQSIYVAGGAGGVGHFIVQLAKIYGLRVFSSGGKDDSIALLKDFGVDVVLNYAKQNIVEEILKLTDQKGVDYVFDSTYQASSFEISAKVLKEGGTFIILGGTNLPKEDSTTGKLVAEKKGNFVLADLVPYSKPGVTDEIQKTRVRGGLNDAIRYIETGQLKPIIKTIGWSELIDTLHDMQKGKSQQGKVVFDLSRK
jgi:NADPH:quinone reductase-like Zn-dependent oxidoreductase